MGRLATRFRREFSKALQSKIVPLAAIQRGQQNAESIPRFDQLVEEGRHPLLLA